MFTARIKPFRGLTALISALALVFTIAQPANAVSTATVVRVASMDSVNGIHFDRVAVDSSGNQYVGGHTTVGGSFVAKYDPAGALVWQKNYATSGWSAITGLAINPSGEIVVAGYFQTDLNLGGSIGTRTTIGTIDSYVMKINAEGAILSFRTWGFIDAQDSINAVCALGVDREGNVYLENYVSNSVAQGAAGIDGVHWSSTANQNGWVDSTVIFKLDNDLNVIRATPLPIGFIAEGLGTGGFAVSPSGKLLLAGFFTAATDFGINGILTPNYDDSALMEFDSQANLIKFQTFLGDSNELIQNVSFDSDENIYALGSSERDIVVAGTTVPLQGNRTNFVVKFNATNSSIVWLQKWGVSNYGDTWSTDLGVDSAGNVVISGNTNASNLVVGALDTSATNGQSRLYNLGINSDGTFAWIKFARSSSPNLNVYQGALFDGMLLNVGDFLPDANFGDGQSVSSSSGQFAGFLSKTAISWSNTTPLDPTHTYGSLAQFSNVASRPQPAQPAQPIIQVGSISPRLLDSALGGTVTIAGSDLSKVTAVKLGSSSLAIKLVADKLQVTLPAHAEGYADLNFVTSGGTIPMSNAVQFSSSVNTHLATITLKNPTSSKIRDSLTKFVIVKFVDCNATYATKTAAAKRKALALTKVCGLEFFANPGFTTNRTASYKTRTKSGLTVTITGRVKN